MSFGFAGPFARCLSGLDVERGGRRGGREVGEPQRGGAREATQRRLPTDPRSRDYCVGDSAQE